jgi:hypothetical protein
VVAERLVAHLERSGFVIMRKPILLDTLLLAAVTTKPAVGVAGFGPDWDRGGLGPQSDGLSVPRARLLVNVRAAQQLVMRASHHPPVVELALLVARARGPVAQFPARGSLLPSVSAIFFRGAQNKGRSRMATPFPSATPGRSTKLPAVGQG